MKKLVVILSIISFVGCSKSDDNLPLYHRDVIFDFSVFNSRNEDLLDPATINHYDSKGIKIFYEIDGETKEIYDPHLDYPRHFMIYEHEHEHRIQVSLNDSNTPENSITYIQWNNVDSDTIEVLFESTERSILMRNVWFNGQLIWEWSTIENEYYIITKDFPD
ncbi:MAG: hypothetical protein KAH12_08210 [Anaerolineales bacterium]|nr:hypothetical protein [Anaerolineales bacterium]